MDLFARILADMFLLIAAAWALPQCDHSKTIKSFSDIRVAAAKLVRVPAPPTGHRVLPSEKAIHQPLPKRCYAVSVGIAGRDPLSSFLQNRCHLYAFDCTLPKRVPMLPRTHFYRKCVGSFDAETPYFRGVHAEPRDFITVDKMTEIVLREHTLEVQNKTLPLITRKNIDVLTFDIEGTEWRLFESLLSMPVLPKQIIFEVHLEKSNPLFVPPTLVQNKSWESLEGVLSQFHARNYTVVSLVPTSNDTCCADMTLVRCRPAS